MASFNPLVSIVIPVYNGSDFLGEAIESAINQTYENIEVLVINDGSNDNSATEKICKSYGEKIRYFYKENGGVATALNLGIKKSTAKYFSWLSHDDIYKPHKIESQIALIKKKPNVKIVCSDFEILNQETQCTEPRRFKQDEVFKNGRDILDNWLDFCTFLIEIDCFKKVGLFDKKLKTIQDLEMQMRLISSFSIFTVNEILSTRRQHSNQDSKTKLKFHLKELDQYIINLHDKYGINFFKKEARESLFLTYLNLGIKTMKMSCQRSSKYFFFKALSKRPFSPKLILLILFGKTGYSLFYN
jgi:glycosyltransferase involved in cell wall biosynthesis